MGANDELPELITIEEFMAMLGYKSSVSYYNHRNDKDFPQRVYPGGNKPFLLKSECVAFVKRKIAERRGGSATEGRRGRGRPRKAQVTA